MIDDIAGVGSGPEGFLRDLQDSSHRNLTSAMIDSLADKAKKLGIPVCKFGGK